MTPPSLLSARIKGIRVTLADGGSGGAGQTNFLDQLDSMDTVYLAQPFVQGPAKVSTNLQPMDVVYLAQPFVAYRKAT